MRPLIVGAFGVSVIGCATSSVESTSLPASNAVLFYNITWATSLRIVERENQKLSYIFGVDASGVGMRCSPTADNICMHLDGFSVFSLPKLYLEHPDLRTIWTYKDVNFKIDSVVRLPLKDQNYDSALLISSYAEGKQATLFLYSKNRGLLYIMNIMDVEKKCGGDEFKCLDTLAEMPITDVWSSSGWKFHE